MYITSVLLSDDRLLSVIIDAYLQLHNKLIKLDTIKYQI